MRQLSTQISILTLFLSAVLFATPKTSAGDVINYRFCERLLEIEFNQAKAPDGAIRLIQLMGHNKSDPDWTSQKLVEKLPLAFHSSVRQAIEKSLIQLGSKNSEVHLQLINVISTNTVSYQNAATAWRVLQALEPTHEAVAKRLAEIFENSLNLIEQTEALRVLERMSSRGKHNDIIIPAIAKTLSEKGANPAIRLMACIALSELKTRDPRASQALERVARDPRNSAALREVAEDALRKIKE